MARRVPLHDTERVIEVIKEDGGVILTGFSSTTDIEKVNRDAAIFLKAIFQDVSRIAIFTSTIL